MNIRPLTETDLEPYFALRALSFLDRSDPTDEARREGLLKHLRYTKGLFVGERLMSAARCYPFEMFLAGERTRVGGLASVLSAPEARRRGYVRTLLHDLLSTLADEGVGWMLEYPFDPRFYARYGFATVPTGSEVVVPAEKIFSGAAPDAERLTGDAAPHLEPLYRSWAQHYSLTLCRDNTARPTWARILEENVCYLLEDAYVVFELEQGASGQTLTVHDYAFATPAGRERLFRFVGSFAGQVDTIRFHLPGDEPLAFDLQRFHTNALPILQARIADLKAALTPLASPDETTVVIRVQDDFCAWNDGVFRLELGPNGTRTSRSNAKAETTLDIATLTQLVTGALSPDAALHIGRAEGDVRALGVLTSLRLGKSPFMPSSDYF